MPIFLAALLTMLVVFPEHQELCFKVCLLVFEVHWLLSYDLIFFLCFPSKGQWNNSFKKITKNQFEYSQKFETVKSYKLNMTCTIFTGFYCYLYENFLVLVASQSHYIRLWSIKTFNGKSLENTRCQRIMYCSILTSKIQKGVNPIMPTCFQS